MLRDEIERYTQLSGEDGTHTPIMKIGAYLDGYDKAMENIDKMIAEMEKASYCDKETRIVKNCNASGLSVAIKIINKYCKENTDADNTSH